MYYLYTNINQIMDEIQSEWIMNTGAHVYVYLTEDGKEKYYYKSYDGNSSRRIEKETFDFFKEERLICEIPKDV